MDLVVLDAGVDHQGVVGEHKLCTCTDALSSLNRAPDKVQISLGSQP